MSVPTRLNAPDLVFGLCLIFLGTALALDRMHVIEASRVLRFWPIGLVLFGLSLVVQTLRGGGDGAADPARSPRSFHAGHILGIVLLGILVTQTLGGRETAPADPGKTVSLFAVMSQDQRVSGAESFRGGEMTSVMGGCTLDLRQATLGPGEEATVDVFTLMGGLVLRVPQGWTVDIRAVPVMGGVRDQRAGAGGRFADRRRLGDGDVEVSEPASTFPGVEQTLPPAGGAAPRIVLRGVIVMGGLVIRS